MLYILFTDIGHTKKIFSGEKWVHTRYDFNEILTFLNLVRFSSFFLNKSLVALDYKD